MKDFKVGDSPIHYSTWGTPGARAVLFFHGFPGSHIQAQGLADLVGKHNIFLISADRPGYGGTGKFRTPETYLDGLQKLLLHEGVQNFDVIGVSGGSPWAHVMASRYCDSVRSLNIVCGLASLNSETKTHFSKVQLRGLQLRGILPGKTAETLVNRLIGVLDPEKMMRRMARFLHISDQTILKDPIVYKLMIDSMTHARKQGSKGIAFDSNLYRRDWFKKYCHQERLQKIPTIYYHGKMDKVLNHKMTEWMHKSQPHAQVQYFEDQGHYSLAVGYSEHILKTMIALSR